jgi:hypothetical protein
MIEMIESQVATLPEAARQIFDRIFYVNTATGHAIPPPTMEDWVVQQFGALADVREQTIVKITNCLTLESALFNQLRARRPTPPNRSALTSSESVLEAWITRELTEHDIFRHPERDTTADVFGRIRGRYCITASNIAKYDGWHGVVIFDEPHPLHFGAPQLRDYLGTALRWIATAHAQDPQAIYPLITWNCLPKSGATLMHGHMQIALAHGMHYAHVERWRRAAAAYRANAGANYFDDLFAIHERLGLTIQRGEATQIFAHLTPARNREIVLLTHGEQADKAAERSSEHFFWSPDQLASLADSLGPALYEILRGLIDDMGMRAFNLGVALPPIGPTAEDWRDMPVIARVADRGDALTSRSDIGAMELFATSSITADPFEVAAAIKR